MRVYFILFSLVFAFAKMYAQTDSLNQYDADGEKHGKWIVYLDADWNKVADSSQACYVRYATFIHGGNLYPMAKWGAKGYTLKKNDNVVIGTPGSAILLDGEYKWYDDKNRLISTHILENGIYTYYEYYNATGTVAGKFVYTEQCGDTPEDYCIYIYDKKGNLKVKGPIPREENGKPINRE